MFRAMLDKLDGRVPAQDGQQPLPPVPEANGSQVTDIKRLMVTNRQRVIYQILR